MNSGTQTEKRTEKSDSLVRSWHKDDDCIDLISISRAGEDQAVFYFEQAMLDWLNVALALRDSDYTIAPEELLEA
jgi:hypothetical protein